MSALLGEISPRWMIVCQYDTCRRVVDGCVEYFTRMNDGCAETTDRHDFLLNNLVASVEKETHEVLFPLILDI